MKKQTAIFSFAFINLFRNVIGVVRSKYVAIFIGISEVGVLGLIIGFFNFQNRIISPGLRIALITLLKDKSKEEQTGIIVANIFLLLLANLFFISFSFIFINELNALLFKDENYKTLLKVLVFLSPVFSLKELVESILQAKQQFKIISTAQFFSQLIAIVSVIPLIYLYGLIGVIYNLALWFSLNLSLLIILSIPFFHYLKFQFKHFFSTQLFSLKFAGINFTRQFVLFTAYMILPILIVQTLSLHETGYFFAVWSISNYINILIQALLFVFLPTLREINDNTKFYNELNNNFEILIYLVFPVILVIMAFPNIVLFTLFSEEFTKVSDLLVVLLLAKAVEAYFSYYLMVFVSIAKTKIYFGLDILRSTLFVGLSWWFLLNYGLVGIIWGICITYIISALIIEIALFRKEKLRLNKTNLKLLIKISVVLISMVIFPEPSLSHYLLRIMLIFLTIFFVLDISKYYKYLHLIIKKKHF
ncbi:MAG: hypothetical protein D8M58_00190 [Calditrichaeota bacterium]|nr:MAG: hypothetical protein DWQ03_06890 [Calditrichota bacterium]MBL1203788.1 hypothetical protein [Calditrichota bacterium]NOG43618.1 oligosaccharide flippase family protein [Calditrichota bacterium]